MFTIIFNRPSSVGHSPGGFSCGWYGLKSFLSAVAIIVATAAAQPAGMAVEVLTWPARREDIEWPRHTYG